jgi:hypothetical protein
MRLGSPSLLILLVFLFGLTSFPSAHAINRQFHEDFSSKQYCDDLNTTAWWDTLSGELKLPPFHLNQVGSFDTPGLANAVAVDGDHAFIADETYGLQIIDISDPTTPLLLDNVDTPGYARGLAVAGNHVFVADEYQGLQVIDITDPTGGLLIGAYNTPGFAADVAVAGDHAFVADDSQGLIVIDITDPSNPTLAGSYDTPGAAYALELVANYAYVADALTLQVIDISDPTSPILAGSYDTADYAIGIAVDGDFAYVAVGENGLQIVDISDPTSPTLAGYLDTAGWVYDVFLVGDHAYLAAGDAGLLVVDVSDPTSPALTDSQDTVGSAHGVAVVGEYAFVADRTHGMAVIDAADILLPPVFGGYCLLNGDMRDAVRVGDLLFAVTLLGLHIVDISDHDAPTVLGIYNDGSPSYSVAVALPYAFVTGYTYFNVLDVSDPANPTAVGSYTGFTYATDITNAGDLLYVVDENSFDILDIQDPVNPAFLGSCTIPALGEKISLAGDRAYLANWVNGFRVIDTSDPTNPTVIGSSSTLHDAMWVDVAGDHAYLANYGQGLQVFDVTLTSPQSIGQLATSDVTTNVTVLGDHAFLSERDGGLRVVDISDPANPATLWGGGGSVYLGGLVLAGDHGFASTSAGLQAIQLFSRGLFDLTANRGQSLAVDGEDEILRRIRMDTAQNDSITLEVTTDGGGHWQEIIRNGQWLQITSPGSDLRWRSTHYYRGSELNPACTELTLSWLFDFPLIDSITDVPDDQGGQVRIRFTRSSLDFVDEVTYPIATYNVWRRVDEPALRQAVTALAQATEAAGSVAEDARSVPGFPLCRWQDRMFHIAPASPSTNDLPPGTWEVLTGFAAAQQEQYLVPVATHADSSGSGVPYTVYCITAHTTSPAVWYASLPDSGYSVDNIQPAVPTGFAVAYAASGNHLSWNPCPDLDFQYFRVYRGTAPDFVPTPANLVHTTIATEWYDLAANPWTHHYKIAAVDHVGNESDPAAPETTTAVGAEPVPDRFALNAIVPNPFNPSTTIHFAVPATGGEVTLEIFDTRGRLVRSLLQERIPPGRHAVVWRGRDQADRPVATGVYFCRLQAPGYEKTLKMLMVQ